MCIDNLPPGLPGNITQDYEGFLVSRLRAFIIASSDRSSPSDRPLTDGIITEYPITSTVNGVTNKLHCAPPYCNSAVAQVPSLRLLRALVTGITTFIGDILSPYLAKPTLAVNREQIFIPSRLLWRRESMNPIQMRLSIQQRLDS